MRSYNSLKNGWTIKFLTLIIWCVWIWQVEGLSAISINILFSLGFCHNIVKPNFESAIRNLEIFQKIWAHWEVKKELKNLFKSIKALWKININNSLFLTFSVSITQTLRLSFNIWSEWAPIPMEENIYKAANLTFLIDSFLQCQIAIKMQLEKCQMLDNLSLNFFISLNFW